MFAFYLSYEVSPKFSMGHGRNTPFSKQPDYKLIFFKRNKEKEGKESRVLINALLMLTSNGVFVSHSPW